MDIILTLCVDLNEKQCSISSSRLCIDACTLICLSFMETCKQNEKPFQEVKRG